MLQLEFSKSFYKENLGSATTLHPGTEPSLIKGQRQTEAARCLGLNVEHS